MTKNNNETELQRFTTLINPKTLSNIKLISYFTNKKLYEVINSSIMDYVIKFETNNNTSIQSLIDLQHKFSQNLTPTLEQLEEEIQIEDSKTKKEK
jgi:hypothetical protein